MSKTMKAYVFRRAGLPADVLRLEYDYLSPVPKGQEVLVKVHAAALNPFGWKIMARFPLSHMQKKPAVPEHDFSGVVAGGDLEGTGLSIGQEVFGMVGANTAFKTGFGTLAEYTVTDPALVVPKPANISHEEAASFPLAGLTVALALLRAGGLTRETGHGKRVFINGSSGGVGIWAVQWAKAYSAYVVATSSPSSEALVKSLGADETVDYRGATPSLAAHLSRTYTSSQGKGFDLFFDAVGSPELFRACPPFLKKDGLWLDITSTTHVNGVLSALSALMGILDKVLRPAWLGGTARKFKPLMLEAGKMGPELREAAKMLEAGEMKAVIDHVYPFEKALEAYERQMSDRSKGKVVVSVP